MRKIAVYLFIGSLFLIVSMLGCEPPDDTSSGGSDPGPGHCKELKQYEPIAIGGTPTGSYEVVVEWDEDFPNHTIYRPVGAKDMPLFAWGQGGCLKMGRLYGHMFREIASHGILLIADGHPEGGGKSPGFFFHPVGDALIQAIDYAAEKNKDRCSPLYNSVDTGKVAVGGHSCGGLLALDAAGDPRMTTAIIMDSGLFKRDQEIYDALHTPILFVNGGPRDVGYPNALEDVKALDSMDTVPVVWANLGLGHMGDIITRNGGEFTHVALAWLKYQFWADPESAALFEGDDCGLCIDDDPASKQWTIQKYNGAP